MIIFNNYTKLLKKKRFHKLVCSCRKQSRWSKKSSVKKMHFLVDGSGMGFATSRSSNFVWSKRPSSRTTAAFEFAFIGAAIVIPVRSSVNAIKYFF